MPRARLDTLLPTQLYISELKHQYWSERLSANGVDDYEPVPVKRIGNDLFMTDGHTRAVVLWQLGVREIEAYDDADELDWFAYLEDLKWCRDGRVLTVVELAERIIPHDDYEVKWRGRCEAAHKRREHDPLGGVSIQLEFDRSAKAAVAREVLENLPQWFGIPEAVEEYVTASVDLPFVRGFYLSCGFMPFEEFPDLWGEANPCLYMIRAVAGLDG
jgi:hypothetical protein